MLGFSFSISLSISSLFAVVLISRIFVSYSSHNFESETSAAFKYAGASRFRTTESSPPGYIPGR